jgi:hypothetical protein
LLAWRVRRAGSARYAPDAVVEHEVVGTTVAETFSRAWMAGAFPALVREVPELRGSPLFRRGVSLGGRTRLPLYALVGGVLVRRWTLAAAAGTWWLAGVVGEARERPGTRGARMADIPFSMASDVVTASALVTGSVKARTVVV